MGAIIATALGFEHPGGYVPCALCLQQRKPYYIAIMLIAPGVWGLVRSGGEVDVGRLLFCVGFWSSGFYAC